MLQLNRLAAIAALLSVTGAWAADKKDEGRICTLETTVGSHMPTRVCTTAAEREAVRQNSQQHVSEMKAFSDQRSISRSGSK